MNPATRRPHCLMLILSFALTALALPHAAMAQDAQETTDDNRELFSNFLHNAVLGKFDRADSYAKQLLANNPEPLEVLRYADEHKNSLKTLLLLVNNAEVSDSAKRVHELILEGERQLRRDPQRILSNIEKLGGDPQTEFNAINRLRESGEYAVPWLISTLQDKSKQRLHSRIIRMMPKIGKDAVNPLVIALSMDDNVTKRFVVRALGEIGYPQAVPYLRAVLEDPNAGPELKEAVTTALMNISASAPALGSAAEAFLELARQYYADHGSVRADPRLDTANVWYWREGRLQREAVPREIFDEIMAMRSSEEALLLQSGMGNAIAVWLAANVRREAQLGLDVESVDPDQAAMLDPTKPDDFPRSAYFVRAAGARYAHMVLGLAMQHNEPAVALGAIAALRRVAGAGNLIGGENYKQPLAEALTFPDIVVRIKAALALAHALPTQSFVGDDRVVPILGDALAQTGGQFAIVVDPDESNLNRVMSALRTAGFTTIGEATLFGALERARNELPSVTAIYLATDATDPDLTSAIPMLRSNHRYAMTPIVLLTKEGFSDQAKELSELDPGVASVVAVANENELIQAWQEVANLIGQTQLMPDEALALALDATDALRKIAFSGSDTYDFSLADSALIGALQSDDESLQTSAAAVLALSATSAAQQAIAKIALNPNNNESLRISVFGSLAESAKTNGNLLSEELADQLIDLAMNEPNLSLRTAASQALGALNLPSSKASPIILKFHRG